MSTDRTPLIAKVQIWIALIAIAAVAVAVTSGSGSEAAPLPYRVDLRVLLLDDNSPWVDGIQTQLDNEGVPYTAVPLDQANRQVITPAFLAAGDRAFFQSVVLPSAAPPQLSAAERTALTAFEAKFGVREVAGFSFANAAVGLGAPFFIGDIVGVTATVTPSGLADGFGYLNGPVPFGAGSYSYLSEPLSAASLPVGASFAPIVTATVGGRTGSVIGVYRNGGTEQMVITAAFASSLLQFKYLAHGIVTWMTRGVHLGFNRNHFTFHVDDGFAPVATWDATNNCTPGEDCPRNPDGSSVFPLLTVRMTPADVTFAADWQRRNGYTMWIAFNGFYADAATDPLTQSFVANRASFKWLNHGSQHIYQGCVQDFTVLPWRCTTDANGNVVYVDQATILSEIQTNITKGRSLGLPFDATEYLSGEHSGLFLVPQQAVDNPNFSAALTAAGIRFIGSDASRETGARQVGSATTVPRHPTALYYNAASFAQQVDEYNWLYTTRAQGGSGYCEDNPAVATCVAPLDLATGFQNYIVPTDVAFNLNFIFSNDPRPFYAHTSNLTGDRVAYPWLERLLTTFRSVVNASAPLINQTLGEASTALRRQTTWKSDQSSVTAYVQNNRVVIENPRRVEVPLTVPTGSTVVGASLAAYSGELSAWLPGTVTSAQLPAARITVTGSPTFAEGVAGAFDITAAGSPAPTVSVSGALPSGVTVSIAGGTARVSGTPAVGTAGTYPLTVTAVSGAATISETVQLVVVRRPVFTSAATVRADPNVRLNFPITATGVPAPTITISGSLPPGLSFSGGQNGQALLSGTAWSFVSGRTYTVQLTATNAGGSTVQSLQITVGAPPVFTSASTVSVRRGSLFVFTVSTQASPSATVTYTGTVPRGVSVSNRTGGLSLVGFPSVRGTYTLTLTARNAFGTTMQQLTITVT